MLYVLDMTSRPSLVVLATDDPVAAATMADRYSTEFNAAVVVCNGPPPGDAGTVSAAPAQPALKKN